MRNSNLPDGVVSRNSGVCCSSGDVLCAPAWNLESNRCGFDSWLYMQDWGQVVLSPLASAPQTWEVGGPGRACPADKFNTQGSDLSFLSAKWSQTLQPHIAIAQMSELTDSLNRSSPVREAGGEGARLDRRLRRTEDSHHQPFTSPAWDSPRPHPPWSKS